MQKKSQSKIKTVNPRSTGELTAQTYCKQSKKGNLDGEANELLRCEEQSLYTKHIFTAKLIAFNKEENSLTTKRINGNELFLSVWNPTSLLGKLRGQKLRKPDLLCARLVELGNWLSAYHRSTCYSQEAEQAASWLRNAFLTKIKEIRDNDLLSSIKLKKIDQCFVREIENLTRPDYLVQNHIKFCRIHGDFIIYNMILDRELNLHIIDFGDTRIASNISDVVRFYSNLWAIAHTNASRKSLLLPVANDFLTAYGLPVNIVETPHFKTLMAYNFLIHLCGEHRMRQLNLMSFTSRLELRQITKIGLNWIDNRIQ